MLSRVDEMLSRAEYMNGEEKPMLSREDVVVSRAEYMNEKENVCKEKRSRFRHKHFYAV